MKFKNWWKSGPKMSKRSIPETYGASKLTSLSLSSKKNDIIDLTEINDCEESEKTSSSVLVSNHSVSSQLPCKTATNQIQTNTNSSENDPAKAHSGSADDSICILFEKLQPPPEIIVVNEITIDGREQNQSPDIDSLSIPIPPVIMGSYTDYPVDDLHQIPPLFPEISSERTSSLYQPINSSMNNQIVAPQHSSFPSCKYEIVTTEDSFIMPHRELQIPLLSTSEATLNLTNIPHNPPSHVLDLEKSNKIFEVPKIQCGICLDGPDEIAASERNFTSTTCGHVFCNICIKTSMKTAAKCPKCRKKISSRTIRPLYF